VGGESAGVDDHEVESELEGDVVEVFSLDDFGACVGEVSFAFSGELSVEDVGDDGAEDGVSEVFESFVVEEASVVGFDGGGFVEEGLFVEGRVVGIEAEELVECGAVGVFFCGERLEEVEEVAKHVAELEWLLAKFFDDDAGVVSPEAEGIGEGGVDFSCLGFVEGEVEVVVDVGVVVVGLVVDGGWDDVVVDGEDGSDGFQCPCGAEEVSGHGFGGTDVEEVGVLSEDLFDGFGFGDVANGGGGSVDIDIVYFVGFHLGVVEGVFHD